METGSAASGNGLSQTSRMRAQFECPFCGDKTQFLQDLMNHLMANHVWLSTSETLALQCPRCSICFVDSVESLINHFRLSHNEFKCLWLLNLVTNVKYMTALIVKVDKKRVAVIRSAYPIDFVDLTTEDTDTNNVNPIGLDQIVNSSHENKEKEASSHPTPIKVELLKEETASLKSLCLEDSRKNDEESKSRIEALPRCPHCPNEVKSVGEFIIHMKEHGDNAYVNWKEYTNNLVKSQRISQIEDQLHLKQFMRSVLDNIGKNGIVPVTSPAPGIKASENTETPRIVESLTLSTTTNPDVSKSPGTEGTFDWLMVRDEKNPAWTQFAGQVVSESIKSSASLSKKRKIQPKKSPKTKKPKVKLESVADKGVSRAELIEVGEPKNQKLESGRAEAEDDVISMMNTDPTASPAMSDEELTKSAQNTVPKITLSSEFLKSLVVSRGNAPLPIDSTTLIQAAKDIVSGAAPVEEIVRKKRRVPSQHWIKPKPYQCDICGEQSANRLRYDLHMTEHRMMDNPYWCTVKGCKFCSTSRTLLFHHVSSVHPFVEKDAIERMYVEGDERKRILEAEENDRRIRASNLATSVVNGTSYIIREPPSLIATLCSDDIPAVESEVIVKTDESAITREELEPRSPTSSPPPTPSRTSPPATLEELLTGSPSYSPSPSPTHVPSTASPSAVQLLSTFFESQHSQMPSWLARAAADIDRVKGEVPQE